MKLALAVGNVDYLAVLDQLTPEQLQEWRAFHLVCPIGPDRIDDAIAVFVCSMIRYVGGFVGGSSEELRELTPEGFIPSLRFREYGGKTPTSEQQDETALIAARVNMDSTLILAGQGQEWW